MNMAASRMSRIAGCRLPLLSLLVATALAPALSSSNKASTPESVDDAEVLPGYVVFSAADGDTAATASPFDLKKHNSNSKKFQKFYPKTESEWNFKGEGKKTDVYIKDTKDNRLLRLISEGLITPQDVLPIVSNDAIVSSQKNVSKGEISVTVQPEGMSGIVDDGLAADSDEKIIMEKKKNPTKEKVHQKLEIDASRESDESVKINLDANAGVQSPSFTKQKDSIAVPAQKQISLSKGKESHAPKRLNDAGYDVISLHKQIDGQSSTDEGVFDFVDTPLSNKNLVPAGTSQTSRINVKKGPNGKDYEYVYYYYYYDDDDIEEGTNNREGNKPATSNDIPVPVGSSTPAASRTTTPISRHSSTPATRFTKTFDDNLGTRIKSTDVLNEPASVHSQTSRDKFNARPDFRYTVDSAAVVSPYPTIPNKPIASNDLSWQYEQNNRYPGRQIPPQSISKQSQVTVNDEILTSTRQPSRGRVHYNTQPATTTDDSSYLITAQPISTIAPPRETQTRGRSSGNVKQPGLELVDSNSFRTHSTRVPTDYDQFPTPIFESPVGKSLKQNSDSTVSQNILSLSSSTKGDILKTKVSTIEYTAGTERLPQPTPPHLGASPTSTEINVDNTAPQSTLQEGTLTTVYGAGLTDKAAHDLYAIYQQTQNEETVKNTIAQDDRTTVVDELEGSQFVVTNLPITTLFVPTTTITTTTTTTTTTTPTPAPTTTIITTTPTTITSTFAVQPGRGRFRGSSPRSRHTTSTTEAAAADGTSEATERTRSKFQPQSRREPGHRISAYGRKSTTLSSDGEISSSTISSNPDVPTRHSYSSRNRYRGSGNLRSENSNSVESSTSAPSQHSKPNFSERFNSRRRPGLRSTTSPAPSSLADEELAVKQEASSEANSIDAHQSTTFRSTRNKYNHNQNQQVRPLRPGPKINLVGRGRFGGTSTTTIAVPLDADTSGSADVPVEQRHTAGTEENADGGDASSDTAFSSTQSPTTPTTVQPDALHRLKNRPKLRFTDKSAHAKAQQSNATAAPNQNRRHLVNNLLPRKRQPTTSTESHDLTEEKVELSPRPVSEDVVEETAPKSDAEALDSQQETEVSSTTESKLSSLLASRRRNLSRKPGTLVQQSKQTATEDS